MLRENHEFGGSMQRSSVITCCIAALAVVLTFTVAALGWLVTVLVLIVRSEDGDLAREDDLAPKPEPKPIVLPIGKPWNNVAGDVGATEGTTKVLSFKQPVSGLKPVEDGAQWAQFEVEVCNKHGPTMRVSSDHWGIRLADGDVVQQVWLPDDINPPKPEFPTNAPLTAGHCVRGKIVYPVLADERVVAVWHRPGNRAVMWAVP
ncbi:hypothetical protein [Streptomyces chartreusis]